MPKIELNKSKNSLAMVEMGTSSRLQFCREKYRQLTSAVSRKSTPVGYLIPVAIPENRHISHIAQMEAME